MIQFQAKQKVSAENRKAFEEVIETLFVPAVSAQDGFVAFRLLEEYPEEVRGEIDATTDGFHLVVQLTFETEEQRRAWVATPEHAKLGEGLAGLIDDAHYTGYSVLIDA